MEISKFATLLLFGSKLDDKLFDPKESFTDDSADFSGELPLFPIREKKISHFGKIKFPRHEDLKADASKAQALHTFANHELLAIEIMAYALLKFKSAPKAFRLGIAKTILEEQTHFRLYQNRIQELGGDFGDFGLSRFFWDSIIPQLSCPRDFVVSMSMTFEQANLDFSLYYQNLFLSFGDEKTSSILNTVYEDEIGHVKFGVHWFDVWRDRHKTEWDAYTSALRMPLTPKRAKGFSFSKESRVRAGFSPDYIQQLGMQEGSIGRPQTIWFYNPLCDTEISRGKPGFSASAAQQKVIDDLELSLCYLAHPNDVLWVRKKPSIEFLESLSKIGVRAPEFKTFAPKNSSIYPSTPHSLIESEAIAGFEPWGWSPDTFELFRMFAEKIVPVSGTNGPWQKEMLKKRQVADTGFQDLFSKAFSAKYFAEWIKNNKDAQKYFSDESMASQVIETFPQIEKAIDNGLKKHMALIAKAPFGTSGMQVRKISTREELNGPLRGWVQNTLSAQKALIIEPYLARVADLSMQLEVGQQNAKLLGLRKFVTGASFEYRGTYLGKKLVGFSVHEQRFLMEALPTIQKFFFELAQAIRSRGYVGPCGIDLILWKAESESQKFFIKPLSELNPRWTMGRVALELEARLSPSITGAWIVVPIQILKEKGFESAAAFEAEMKKRHAFEIEDPGSGEKRLKSGIVMTTPPETAEVLLTALVTADVLAKEPWLLHN